MDLTGDSEGMPRCRKDDSVLPATTLGPGTGASDPLEGGRCGGLGGTVCGTLLLSATLITLEASIWPEDDSKSEAWPSPESWPYMLYF